MSFPCVFRFLSSEPKKHKEKSSKVDVFSESFRLIFEDFLEFGYVIKIFYVPTFFNIFSEKNIEKVWNIGKCWDSVIFAFIFLNLAMLQKRIPDRKYEDR